MGKVSAAKAVRPCPRIVRSRHDFWALCYEARGESRSNKMKTWLITSVPAPFGTLSAFTGMALDEASESLK
jgi:hypothetical protein